MAQVDITINNRAYKVSCDDGQEDRLRELAAHFDGHVSRIVRDLGQIGDARLMLLAALTLSDELVEARDRLAALETAGLNLDEETAGGAARVIAAAARRVDGIADKLGR